MKLNYLQIKNSNIYSLSILPILCLLISCQPENISNLKEMNGIWFKNGNPYSGKVYKSIRNKQDKAIFDFFGIFNFGDSLVLDINDGMINSIDYYNSRGHFAKQEFLEDSITRIEYYHTEYGIWDVKLIDGVEHFKNGIAHGLRTYSYSGNRIKTYYNNGLIDKLQQYRLSPGLFTINEILISETVHNNSLNISISKKYFNDGVTLSEVTEYVSDRLKNKTLYDLNGKIIESIVDGQIKEINLNGIVELPFGDGRNTTEYKNGKKNGKEFTFYPNNQVWVETTYLNGKKDGVNRRWYKDGQISIECFYVLDILNGTYSKWYSNGQLWESSEYRNGDLVGQKKWYKDGKPAFK